MREVDEQGVWEVNGNVKLLVEPTAEWIAQNQPVIKPPTPEPTTEEYLIDLDYRLSKVELGI